MKISVDVEISSSQSKVWAVITDINNCKNMISGITDLEVIHQPKDGLVGLKWIETRKLFGKESSETMWITEAKDEEYYCTRAENCGAIYSTKIVLSEAGSKTRLTMSFSGTSESRFIQFISSIMNLFIKKSILRMLQQDLDDIKEFIEKSSVQD